MKDFVIRGYQKGDEQLINREFNTIFGLKRPIQEWYWKFKHPNESRIMLSLDRDQMLSHYAVQAARFQYQGDIYTAGHSVDTFSIRRAKATSGRSLEKLVQSFFREFGGVNDIALMYGFPGRRILRLGSIKLDYGIPLAVKYWELKPKFSDLRLQGGMDHPGTPSMVDELWSSAAHRYPVSIIRDYKWIYRRYISRPNNEYRFVYHKVQGRYTVLCVYVKKARVLEVVDIIWDGQNENDIKFITSILASIALKKALRKVSMWLSGDEKLEAILERNRWMIKEEPNQLHLVVKSFTSKIDREDLLSRFYLTKGCSDII